ncbi:DUF2511 domain-containing protein [Gloeobacter kilaueensis]|uniref:DUF2511 domain-containing protein n=1 Tax=Gloeobacter kilaueensis (strain ATCC BAA-2537 / CCAP 1431/1 / ULC 316 / JS1) TaxID=1183438 RepID=U5QGI4_GLOK1|nr:DUF2511 domain-containing protein [Gloeobacter kilaueensis]AGY56775.1 hypothetical protein GKIL_0529 [Gloeobacter kilaueensis JS1]
MMRTWINSLVLLSVVGATVVGCSSGPKIEGRVVKQEARKVDFGASWPFTVDKGDLACINGSQLVFIARGRAYALNEAAARKFDPIDSIQADDPDLERAKQGIKMPLDAFIDKGRQLCSQSY